MVELSTPDRRVAGSIPVRVKFLIFHGLNVSYETCSPWIFEILDLALDFGRIEVVQN
jgi:hypothetical protein